MDFTDSYYTARQTVLLRADSPYTSIEEMKGKGLKIGAQTGTTGMISAAPELTEEANIVGYNNGSLAVEALLNGNVDAVIIDNNPANEYKDQHGDAIKLLENQFEDEYYCIAVRKGNSALQEAINQALKELKDEGEFRRSSTNTLNNGPRASMLYGQTMWNVPGSGAVPAGRFPHPLWYSLGPML